MFPNLRNVGHPWSSIFLPQLGLLKHWPWTEIAAPWVDMLSQLEDMQEVLYTYSIIQDPSFRIYVINSI